MTEQGQAKGSLASRQRLLAEFLNSAELEAELRRDPALLAERYSVPLDYVRWLAGLEPRRVAAFRRTQAKKRHGHG